MITEKTISDFLSNEYKEFAMYSIEGRAIPSVIDGFKPVQRKIIHVCSQIWKTGNEKPLKVFQLAGKVASDAFYHHGNASLESAIITMAQKFKNSIPLLEEDGQYGSLRSTTPGAARYIGTRLNENFRYLYKDFPLLRYKEEEGEQIEPQYFLPIVPTILLNGSSGIAVGFASNVLNRDIKSVIDGCIKSIDGKKIPTIKPYLNEFHGEFLQDPENHKRWIMKGKAVKVNTSTVRITELPPSMTYEKYEAILDRLIETKEIVSYDDNCKDNIDYVIKFQRSVLDKIDDAQLSKMFKLEEASTEMFITLDENGKLKIFETSEEVIHYFVSFRLKYYDKRKQIELERMHKEVKVISNRGKFIKLILDDKLKINNVAKTEIIDQIVKANLEMVDDSYDYLLKMPIYSLTKELFEKMKQDFVKKKEDIKVYELLDPKKMYIDDLTELKKKFK